MDKCIGILILFLMCDPSFGNELNPEGIYCLSYTWLGPDFTQTTTTEDEEPFGCADYLTIGNNSNTPCIEPLVFSEDTISKPDDNELWEANKTAVACRKSAIQSCAKYTVSFKGMITYQSHLCTRVRTTSEVIRSGCLSEKRNNMDIQVCVCESEKGLNLPCNSASTYRLFAAHFMILGLVLNFVNYFY